jgi:hypothetical protein
MSAQTPVPSLLRSFFEDYLAAQHDVSQNTIYAYRVLRTWLGEVSTRGWLSHVSSGFELAVMVCGGGLTEGRHSQIDGGSAAGGDVVHLGELVFRGGQVGFTAFDLAELTAVLGFFNAHREVQDVNEALLQAHDVLRLGQVELVVRQPGPGPQDHQVNAVTYDVGWQQGNISNVAGSQSNYYHESNLRYIASRRGRARLLIVSGILLFLAASGLGVFDVLNFDRTIFNSINSQSFNPPQLPAQFIPLFGIAAFMNLLGIALFIFGLIVRSGAKKEARRLGAD